MTTACMPPEGTELGTIHWVLHPESGLRVWKWHSQRGMWGLGHYAMTPEDAYERGWIYVGPAEVPDAARQDADLAELKRLRLFRRFLETAASENDTNEPLAVHEWIEMADEAVKQALAFSEVKP
jgi:hypothetical protein